MPAFHKRMIRGKWLTIPAGEAQFFLDFEPPLVRPGQLRQSET